jgi:hypothetical protein
MGYFCLPITEISLDKEGDTMTTNDKSSNENIISIIEQLANQGITLSLTWFFRGLLLSQEVRILSVFRDSAAFHACDNKHFAPYQDCYVQLHHPVFGKPVRAHLLYSSLDNCTFVLSDFSYVIKSWTERSLDRVQPKTFTRVSLGNYHTRFNVSCLDLNAKGIGLFAQSRSHLVEQILPGSNVQLDLTLSSEYGWKRLEGVVIHITPISHLLVRIGIRLRPNLNQAIRLERYISQRKEEIMTELCWAYFHALEPRKVEDLYF